MFVVSNDEYERLGGSIPTTIRALQLRCGCDWGQANSHHIWFWLNKSCAIDGGVSVAKDLYLRQLKLCLIMPNSPAPSALNGTGMSTPAGPMPSLRAFAFTIPRVEGQNHSISLRKIGTWDDMNFADVAMLYEHA